MMIPSPELPIHGALPALLAALRDGPNAVLQAPPGAGKTTIVPLALLDQPWLAGRKIVMLEPRRIAARAAARRMAALLKDKVGGLAGYRVRLESRIGRETRIEVVTDGIFTRMIQDDPALDGIGAVLFDEFHERRLDTDLGLALCLDAQAGLRPDLRLVAMSATLDAQPIAALMGDAPVVTATGRSYPVAIRHRPAPAPNRLAEAVADAVLEALHEPGGILVFLPGGGEIRRVQRLLTERRLPQGTTVLPLFGDLDQAAQDKALAPAPPETRKIVLATSIAETSLTIDGVRQVIDAGLARLGRYDPRTGMTRLDTVKVTQAGAEQRAGRAGRTEPGLCWRLWPQALHKSLAARPEPEIATSDLAPLVLELASWGIADPALLKLPDPPSPAGFAGARRLLADLGALDEAGRLTAHGRRMASFGLHPRLAHMLLGAAERGEAVLGAAIAAALGERDIAGAGPRDADLRRRLEWIENPRGNEDAARAREMARRHLRPLGVPWGTVRPAGAGAILALAYPDRIAQRRPEAGRFRLSGGQGAWLPETDPLAGERFLAVADIDGQMPEARIWLAAPLSEVELENAFSERIETRDEVVWEPATRSVRARRRRRLGALVLSETLLADPNPAAVGAALIDGIRRTGLACLPWTEEATALRARIAFLGDIDGAGWPAMSDADLLEGLETWLGPALAGKRGLGDLAAIDLAETLRQSLDWGQRRDLDRRAPSHWTVPSGSRIAIDYTSRPPVLAVKLQEMFGLAETPSVADGRVKLTLHLLSPARRPIQVTSDLAGFWAGSYKAVRADLRGRYPRHPWPDDPLAAAPTARAKPRGT